MKKELWHAVEGRKPSFKNDQQHKLGCLYNFFNPVKETVERNLQITIFGEI